MTNDGWNAKKKTKPNKLPGNFYLLFISDKSSLTFLKGNCRWNLIIYFSK